MAARSHTSLQGGGDVSKGPCGRLKYTRCAHHRRAQQCATRPAVSALDSDQRQRVPEPERGRGWSEGVEGTGPRRSAVPTEEGRGAKSALSAVCMRCAYTLCTRSL